MAALTPTQVTQLNNSMEAAQRISLGTIVGDFSASGTVKSGTVTPVSGSLCLVATGLTTPKAVVVSMAGTPTGAHALSSACIVGTNINIKSFGYSASEVSLGTFVPVYWIAVGER